MPDWRRLFERLRHLASAHPKGPVPEEVVRKGYEPSDVNLRAVALVAATILVLALLIHAALLALLNRMAAQEGEHLPVPSEVPPTERFPAPTLQVAPAKDLAEFRQLEADRLKGYHWIDRSKGVVQIPIDRAMDLLAERGLPERPRHAP